MRLHRQRWESRTTLPAAPVVAGASTSKREAPPLPHSGRREVHHEPSGQPHTACTGLPFVCSTCGTAHIQRSPCLRRGTGWAGSTSRTARRSSVSVARATRWGTVSPSRCDMIRPCTHAPASSGTCHTAKCPCGSTSPCHAGRHPHGTATHAAAKPGHRWNAWHYP